MIYRTFIAASAVVLLTGALPGLYVASGFSRTFPAVSGFRRTVAQTTDKNPLAAVKSLKCRFPVYTVGSWKNGEAKAEVRQAQQFSLDIDEIDTDDGSARVTGTAGPTHVTALLTISSLHFMERTVTGTLTVTTVFASEAGARTFRAVHSRHDYLPMSLPGYTSEPSVSQNYGVCDAVK